MFAAVLFKGPQYLEDYMKQTIRYGVLLLAVLPLLIAGFLLIMQGINYLLALGVLIPALTAMSVLSAFLAFTNKDPEHKLVRTTKVLSLISMAVFGILCVIALYTMTVPL